jgi:drug/metabolite transporter (DMT)-like permease
MMLVGVTLLWGVSFPLTKGWLNTCARYPCPGGTVDSALTLISLRMTFALCILAVVKPRLFLSPTWREYGVGFAIGVTNFAGFQTQVVGADLTTPALSAFLTSLGSIWVPLIALMLFRIRLVPLTFCGLGVALVGAGVLARIDQEGIATIGPGERLTLISSVIFAFMIVILDRWGRQVRPGNLTIGFLTGTGLPAILLVLARSTTGAGTDVWFRWTSVMLHDRTGLVNVCLLTVLCSVLTFHWMTSYQPRVPAARAALIYLLEPVFAAGFSMLWGYDELTPRLILGGGLILGGNLLVEIPAWLRSRRS